jgi:hypothetical protein
MNLLTRNVGLVFLLAVSAAAGSSELAVRNSTASINDTDNSKILIYPVGKLDPLLADIWPNNAENDLFSFSASSLKQNLENCELKSVFVLKASEGKSLLTKKYMRDTARSAASELTDVSHMIRFGFTDDSKLIPESPEMNFNAVQIRVIATVTSVETGKVTLIHSTRLRRTPPEVLVRGSVSVLCIVGPCFEDRGVIPVNPFAFGKSLQTISEHAIKQISEKVCRQIRKSQVRKPVTAED